MKKTKIEGLPEFFKKAIPTCKVCENCFSRIHTPSPMNIAHILPKSRFKSVATNKNNYLRLCIKCHNKYDSSWRRAMEMPVWKIAKERFLLFKEYVTEKSKTLLNFE